AHAFLRRTDELARDDAAGDPVLKDDARARLARLDFELHTGVLPPATCLALEGHIAARRARHRLAIRHPRAAHVAAHLELALHPVDEDLQVQLTHAGDN